jgi:hypothetical protein
MAVFKKKEMNSVGFLGVMYLILNGFLSRKIPFGYF